MMIGMAWFFRVSKYGLAMRATAFNQQVAQSLGISVKSVFAMAWAISATVSAVAGVVVAVVNGVSSGLSAYGIKVFPAAILGGLDRVGGAVLGGIIIGLLENIAQFVDSEYLHWGNLYEIAPFYVADHHPDDQALRPVRHQRHRAGVIIMAGQTLIPAGDFRTTYAADTTIFPTTTSRNATIAGIVLICFAPHVVSEYWPQPADPDRHLLDRSPRPQHRRRLHRPDLDRPCRLLLLRRLHLGLPHQHGSASPSSSPFRSRAS